MVLHLFIVLGKEYALDVNNYNNLVEKLSQTSDKDEILSTCQEFTRLKKFDWFLLGVCNLSASLNDPDIQIITDYPEKWMSIYSEEKLVDSDPVVSYALNYSIPIIWSKLLELPEYRHSKYDRMMKLAEQYGLRNGVSVPFNSKAGFFGVFSLAINASGKESDEKCKNAVADIQHFASYAQEAAIAYLQASNHSEAESLRKKLTQREYECLFWACEGKTAWEISMILKISERTVLFHLSNLTNKLGASNRQHAVAKALLLGLVKPNLNLKKTVEIDL